MYSSVRTIQDIIFKQKKCVDKRNRTLIIIFGNTDTMLQGVTWVDVPQAFQDMWFQGHIVYENTAFLVKTTECTLKWHMWLRITVRLEHNNSGYVILYIVKIRKNTKSPYLSGCAYTETRVVFSFSYWYDFDVRIW